VWALGKELIPAIAVAEVVPPRLSLLRLPAWNQDLDATQVHHPAPGIRLALRLFAFWTLRGLESEARRWLVAFVELADRTARDGDRQRHDTGTRAEAIRLEDRALAITALGLMSSNQGDYREGVCQKIVERCTPRRVELRSPDRHGVERNTARGS
jgi:hypothetical protein